MGLRVVCLFLPDMQVLAAAIRSAFAVVAEDDKLIDSEVSSFGYFSVHFDVTLPSTYSGARYDGLHGMVFEIQLRTIAMDAWASISHHLSYRTDRDVPQELKRDFYALSGLFYVADKHFEFCYQQRLRSQQDAASTFATGTPAQIRRQPLNFDTLVALLDARFTDRTKLRDESLSVLVDELGTAGYVSSGEVDDMLAATEVALAAYERDLGGGIRLGDVGAVRASMYLHTPHSRERAYEYWRHDVSRETWDKEDLVFAKYRQLVR